MQPPPTTPSGPDGTQPEPPSTAPRQVFPARRVYAVFGVPPEIQAYAMAKYSRSSQGMLESIQELSQQRAEQFLNTFYFQYGHRSIADLAHVVFGLEQISLLAAIEVVDEPSWDGQERSTRYQPFRKTGWFTPPSLPDPAAYDRAAGALFGAYEQLTEALTDLLQDAVERPPEMAEGTYRRTLRARAFDVSRGLLPLATHTSVGQVVSARVLEGQISRLLSSPYPELQAVGDALRAASREPAEAPLLGELTRAGVSEDALAVLRPRSAPTLVKYAAASDYLAEQARDLAEAARSLLGAAGPPDRSRRVTLAPPARTVLDEVVATLLYRHDAAGHSYPQALAVVEELSAAQKDEVLGLSMRGRGRHDEPLREHRAGYALAFDILMDVGSFRDLHRHRRCVQVRQPYTWEHGALPAEATFVEGLGPATALAALEAGLGDLYQETLAKAEQAAAGLTASDPLAAPYLLPLAFQTRCLFKMDWAEAAYIVEQRTAPAGHFSYRRVAWEMLQALRERDPSLAAWVRATDPSAGVDLLQR